MNARRLAAALLALAGWPLAAGAQDLLSVWRAAEQHDRTLAVARAEHAAAQTRREQAAALWRPQIGLVLGAGLGAADTRMKGAQFAAPGMGSSEGVDFATSVHAGLATRAALTAQQPLMHPAREAARVQLELGAEMGDSAWRAARIAALLRTAQRYFALALADEALRVAERQAEALARARTEAHDRFQIGESPVTDTHEADAALAGVRAQVEAARLQRELARQALADSTGLAQPSARLPGASAAPGQSLAAWTGAALAAKPQLRQAAQGVAMAGHELRRRRAGDAPSLDLVAQAGFDRLGGRGEFGSASNRNASAMVGLQLTIPLYDGGHSRAQASEGARLLDKAQAQLEQAREQVTEQVRSAWLGWQAGAARVDALQGGLRASAARLDATRLGRAVGDRTLLDVLNAENDHARATLALAEALTEQLQQRLRLAALADALDDALLAELNAALQAPPAGAGQALAPASGAAGDAAAGAPARRQERR